MLATTSLGAIVYAITQGSSAGWTSIQTAAFGLGGLAGLAAFAADRAAHTDAAAPRVRAARRSRRRRRPLPDARRCRIDLRPLPALLALPAERPRHGPAADRPRVHPARPRRRGRRARSRAHRQPPRRSRAARGSVRDRGSRYGSSRPRRRERHATSATSSRGCSSPASGSASPSCPSRSRSSPALAKSEIGNDLRPQLDRPRDRRHDRNRDLLDDRSRGERSARRPCTRPQPGSRTHSWQPGSSTSLASLVAFAVLPHARDFVPKLRLNPPAMPVRTDNGKADDTGQTATSAAARTRIAASHAILQAALEALASDPDASMAEIARQRGCRAGHDLRLTSRRVKRSSTP